MMWRWKMLKTWDVWKVCDQEVAVYFIQSLIAIEKIDIEFSA